MTFTLSRNLHGKAMAGMPVTIEVGPAEDRKDYRCPANCATVYPVSPDSIHTLIERNLVLGSQREDKVFVCDCLGSIQSDTKLNLTRPLAVLDLETTDAEPTTCAIFQFGVAVVMPDGSRKCWDKTFKPWTPITPEAEEVTGTTNAMVENCPPFRDYAAQILKGLEGKDLAGFNLKSFDLVCLDEELRRCGLRLNMDGVTVIDAFHLFQRKDPRDLTAAVKKFCGRDHEGAHGAQADATATADVIDGMLTAYPDLADMSLADLDKFSMRDPERQLADLAGKFYRDSDGDLRYTLAKVRDVKVRDDVGFGRWMLKQNSPPFAGSTREVLIAEIERLGL